MNTPQKDTIYIDIDDEITTIIEKMRESSSKVLALVLPKRASVFQSIVNMKLLKRAADDAGKSIVLITSDANLLPLAGSVGLYVAKNLQSKPTIPSQPTLMDDAPLTVNADDSPLTSDEDTTIDPTLPIGTLAGMTAVAGAYANEDETIEVDNQTIELDSEDDESVAKEKREKKPKPDKKLKVPNFNKFRIGLFVFIFGLIGIGVLWYMAYYVLPQATISIKTNTSSINSDVVFTASASASTADIGSSVVPLQKQTINKKDSQSTPATGHVDKGTKATGKLTLTNCIDDGLKHTIPAGTGFSNGQQTFVTDQDITLNFAVFAGNTCESANFGLSKSVGVTANQAGSQYNLNARSYTSPITGITAYGSDMSGGTSNIVKIISQNDIDSASQKIQDSFTTSAPDELNKQFLAVGALPLSDSISAGTPIVTTSPNAGDIADQVTVTVSNTYTMYGVNKSDLQKLIDNDVRKHIDTTKQNITDNGSSKITIKLLDKSVPAALKAEVQTTAIAGAEENTGAIKQLVSGKKKGDTINVISSRPGIQSVTVKYNYPWVSSTPTKLNKITVTFQSADGSFH